MLFPSICHSGKVKSITSSRALFDSRCHEQPLMNLIPSWCHEFSILYIQHIYIIYRIYIYIYNNVSRGLNKNSIPPQDSGESLFTPSSSFDFDRFCARLWLPCSPQHYCHKHHVNVPWQPLGPLLKVKVGYR